MWFERDTGLRAQLAFNVAQPALLSHWDRADRKDLRDVLTDIAHDERIMAVAACGPDFSLLAESADFPSEFSCATVGGHVHPREDAKPWQSWQTVSSLPGGLVQVNAMPLTDGQHTVGFVILVHDLSYLQRRESTTRQFLLYMFGFLGVAASGVTIIAARLSWRGWSDELRSLLRTGKRPAHFQPVLRDILDLAERIVGEKEAEEEGGVWSAQRLRHVLSRRLQGEKVVIIANREPYIHEYDQKDGHITITHPASGLVTALEPVMRACSGAWVAHGGGSADRETVDSQDRIKVPPGEEFYSLRRVWLTPEEEKGYYYGFANEGLWPLCHLADARPAFRSQDWKYYQEVNQRFVDAACQEADSADPVVLVQDYHFAMAPRMLRERLPRSTVITFWHIPWPNSERFGICPWRTALLEGMLGSSILGFQTQFHCNNFMQAVDRFLEARVDRDRNAVVQHGRTTLIRPYPISLEWPIGWLRNSPSADQCRASVFAELGLGPDALLGVGVDRLDYTKGIEERLLAVERLLERFPEFLGRFTFVQLAAPSRTEIERYRRLGETVKAIADRINQHFSDGPYRPIIILRAHHEPPTVFRYYRAADVCYVSSLHDGMNLVAKEFVAAREDLRGVLVLSEFAGAAQELAEALVVNPYDLEEASSALASALRMSGEEQEDRMRAMRAFISEFNVYRWAGRMLVDAGRIRRQERLMGRFSDRQLSAVTRPQA